MHAPFDRSRNNDYSTVPRSDHRFVVVPVLIAIVLLTLAFLNPKSSIWISEAVQAEFDGSRIVEDKPIHSAEPGMAIPMHTVHAY